VAVVVMTACHDNDADGSDESTAGDDAAALQCRDGSLDLAPFRDEWRVEADVAFEHEGGAITALTVGGLLYDKNFANRGDVIVTYDAPPDRIVVEMRRFTFGASAQSAQDDFDALSLWAYNSSGTRPQPPLDMLPKHDCVASGAWRNECTIRVYYDGQSQLVRTGADLRVRLPADYTGQLDIVTEDNDAEGNYLNRGNVCVDGLAGATSVELGSGVAFVRVADVAPTPTCPPADVAACEAWPEGAWSSACPCIAAGYAFGGVSVRTTAPAAADATVDLPADLWSAVRMANEGPGQDAADPALHCDAALDLPNLTFATFEGNDFPWESNALSNLPSEAATLGAGFTVNLTSSGCAPVEAVENPDEFDCTGQQEMMSEERGNLRTCEGCLGVASCDDLLP
jgi:hypothetical protein